MRRLSAVSRVSAATVMAVVEERVVAAISVGLPKLLVQQILLKKNKFILKGQSHEKDGSTQVMC